MILGSGIQEGLLLKPVTYSWAYDLYNQAVANTWFPNEIQLDEGLRCRDYQETGYRNAQCERGARRLPRPYRRRLLPC